MSGIAFEDQFLGFLDGAIRQQKRMADRAMVQFIVLRLLMVIASASLPALTTEDLGILVPPALVCPPFRLSGIGQSRHASLS